MKDSPLFLRTTRKLYDEVNTKKTRDGILGWPHLTHLDIKLEKDFFQEDEWNFLKSSESKFKFPVHINETLLKWFQVYHIESDILATNELNVMGIRNKYHE
jgi:hypothetical protein